MELLSANEHFGLGRVSRCRCVRWFAPSTRYDGASLRAGQVGVYVMHGYQPHQTSYFGDILYVGVTDQPATRWRAHRYARPWWPDVVQIQLRICRSRVDALDHERDLIEALDPLYNRTGPHHERREEQVLQNCQRLPAAIGALAGRWALPA